MLNVDYWVELAKTKPIEEVVRAAQQDAYASCRILAGQKWKLNMNGQWRAACLSIIKGIKVLEGADEEEKEE